MDMLVWLPLLLIELCFYKFSESSQTTNRFKSIKGCKEDYILPNKAFLVVSVNSLLECSARCARTNGCNSFNTCPEGNTFNCSLLSSFQTTGCSELEYREHCKHREYVNTTELVQEETANPCCNGGSYTNGTCICVWGFAGPNCCRLIRSCREGYLLGIRGEDYYEIQPFGAPTTFNVSCNCQWVGTISIFRRFVPPPAGCTPISYNRTWQEYKEGFGDPNCEYFLGLETLYQLNRYAKYQLNIYNVIGANPYAAASIYMEDFSIMPEATNYEITFIRIFTQSWEHGDDAFGGSEKPRRFCAVDRDCGGCAGSVGGGWWFTSTCQGGALTAPPEQMVWPVHSVDKSIILAYVQLDLMSYL